MATMYQAGVDTLDYTPDAAVTGGDVLQLADGRAAHASRDIAAGALGAVAVAGIVTVAKTANIVLLDGGEVYWDHSAGAAHYKRGADRDFFIGTLVGDAAAADTTCKVNLNVRPNYDISLADGFRTLMILTAGTPRLLPNGRAGAQATFSATAEAQKIDALSNEGFGKAANAIVEARITVVDGGDNAALDINVGVASGTHATDADQIANSLFVHMDGNSTNINLESDDATTEVAATDTTLDYTAGTPIDVWFDLRNPADIQCYVNGALVLADTVFTLAAATDPLKLLIHMEKTADDTTANVAVDWLRARIAQK